MAGHGHLETRVLAGTLKGRAVRYPRDSALRPTMQRTKASVFESLGDRLEDSVFLDLYAAAGGVGIEALSRGARLVHFVEKDGEALRYLRENLSRCGIGPDRGVVHPVPVMSYLLSGALRTLDPGIVYADPPYDVGEVRLLLEFFQRIDYPLRFLLIVEHRRELLSLEPFTKLVCLRVRRFGQSCVSYIALGGEGS